jgi:hypothetical protein
MTLKEDFEVHAKALSYVRQQTKQEMQDILTAYRGVSHRVNQQAAEVEDLWKNDQEKANLINELWEVGGRFTQDLNELKSTVDKIAAYLRKKFPEDFKKETRNDDTQ